MKRRAVVLVVVIGAVAVAVWRLASPSNGSNRRTPIAVAAAPLPQSTTTSQAATSTSRHAAAPATSAPSTTTSHPAPFSAGMNVVYYSRQISDPTAYVPPLLDELARDQVNNVSLVFPIYTDGATSTTRPERTSRR